MLRGVRIAALATLWLVPLLILVSAFSSGWVTTWRALGVPSMTPPFLDLYGIPASVETLHQGLDPMVTNPSDPYHRPLNYPRVWLYLFSAAGITRGNVSAAGIVLCGFYLFCMSYLILQMKHAVDSVIILFVSLSVAPLFAIERGNNDLVVFSLVFLACVATNRYLKSGLFSVAALLKLYPIVGMTIDAIRRPLKERLLAALLILCVIFVLLLQWHDLTLIRHGTPVSRSMSFGVLSFAEEILHETSGWHFLAGLGWVVVLECWLAGALTVGNAWRNPLELDDSISNSRFAEMFSVFGGIYVFAYAIGSNWDYRLIFLLPTLPLAMEMARSPRYRRWAIAYLLLVGVAENSIGFETSGGTLVGHIATFALFIFLLTMLTNQNKSFLVSSKILEFAEREVPSTSTAHAHSQEEV